MGFRVMLVDDALFMRTLLRGILEDAGCEIAGEAADGSEALAVYRQSRPDITFMDIVMPNRNGIEALKEIIAHDPAARVVMCSAVGQEVFFAEARAAGALDYILKPFNANLIRETLARVMER